MNAYSVVPFAAPSKVFLTKAAKKWILKRCETLISADRPSDQVFAIVHSFGGISRNRNSGAILHLPTHIFVGTYDRNHVPFDRISKLEEYDFVFGLLRNMSDEECQIRVRISANTLVAKYSKM